jgi:SAM-dependent methyltransferase
MVYADTSAAQATYDRYYADASKYSGVGTGISETDAGRFADLASELGRHFDQLARIADVGCGNGGLVRALQSIGFANAIGIDPSRDCAALLGASGRVGSLWDLSAVAGRVDCLVLSHVLEHVRDVRRAVEAMAAAAPAVYIEVPDARRYVECLVAPYQDLNVEHINHFSLVSLTNALASGGFRVTASGHKTIESSPGMPYPAVWAIGRIDGPDRGFVVDRDTARVIRDYLARSRAELDRVDARLRRSLRPGDDIVIWGTGQTVLTTWPETVLRECHVHAFIDSSPLYRGRALSGIRVVEPAALPRYPHPVVIGSVIHEAAIRAQIAALGVPNTLISLVHD